MSSIRDLKTTRGGIRIVRKGPLLIKNAKLTTGRWSRFDRNAHIPGLSNLRAVERPLRLFTSALSCLSTITTFDLSRLTVSIWPLSECSILYAFVRPQLITQMFLRRAQLVSISFVLRCELMQDKRVELQD
ncbi:uncharacterized protein BO72DRAFT_445554 [Aspergillus fijiensis CBS 313.89]|uniref:Uncharacterized protein n=1 Tax=Aspergillus fijiensis CBS 313.89 TaxID=1448319 RepID=A0A8G1RXK9_9EURO|nr:uncharacterized protein BO72DRAFT_445554 [Aspergillus fijiensis CBS 313.89]RAK80153.1 hypothetical protein BO72DRAFT_445554 [Aspergillus fijiensis CBS 313.89]